MKVDTIIKEYPDYTINNNGEIFSYKYKKPRKIKAIDNGHGYLQILLYKNGKCKRYMLSRLIYETFIGPIGSKTINHKDGNKTNNRLENLEIITSLENIEHAFKNKLHNNPKKSIKQITHDGTIVKIHKSLREAAKQTKINSSSIGQASCGKRKTAGGFLWQI